MAETMSLYDVTVDQLPETLRRKVRVVENVEALNRAVAAEFADALAAKRDKGELLTVILPVGPLDYRYFVQEVNRRGLGCRNLRTINMDEYLGPDEKLIPTTHPLSFRRFMDETFFSLLADDRRPAPENVLFPDPGQPERVTELIDSIGGADLCWGAFGITGHVAFNDPPQMTGEPTDLEAFRNCKTRKVTISPMSMAQMAMGGTGGNMLVIPTRAVTVGMYELLKSKCVHLTFMRNWHAGLWRRAMLGPVTSEFPGSLLHEHPNLKITLTKLAAARPAIHTAQTTGEGA